MNLSAVSTEALLSELATRSVVHPEDACAPAKALVTRLCEELGMSPPAPDDTLADWADTVLDSPLAPRGGVVWLEGNLHLLDAVDAALQGSEALCRQAIGDAIFVVRARGNDFCACDPLPLTFVDRASARTLCMRCRKRRRS